MSSRGPDSERVLQSQIAELRDELRRLQLRVDRQEDQLLELSREVEDSRDISLGAVDEPSSVASIPLGSGSYSVVTPVPGSTAAGGRERLNPLQSRIYVVLRDYNGLVTEHPARIFSRFSAVKALCFRAGSPGDSVFVGLPSQREARLAVEAAGCSWPATTD